jgi:hypothetical protein
MTNAWGGRSPLDLTTVVVTHQRPEDRPEDDEHVVFVTTGIEDAVARAEEQSDRPAHASFMDSLLDVGFVILGGPLGSNAVARSRTIRGASRTSAWRWSTRGPSGSMGGHAGPRLALGQPTYRPQWRRRSWAGFGAGNQRAKGRAFMR